MLGDSINGDCQGETRMVYGYILGIHHALCTHLGGNGAFAEHWNNSGLPDSIRLRLVGHPRTVKNLICINQCVEAILRIVRRSWTSSELSKRWGSSRPGTRWSRWGMLPGVCSGRGSDEGQFRKGDGSRKGWAARHRLGVG